MAAVPPTTARAAVSVPFFSQRDARYAGSLGYSGCTLYWQGCTVTAEAMVYAKLGVTITSASGTGMNPRILNDFLVSSGGFLPGGCVRAWKAFPPGVIHTDSSSTGLNWAAVDTELAAGRPVIAQVSNATIAATTKMHFVVLLGNHGSTYDIADPWDKSYTARTLSTPAIGTTPYQVSRVHMFRATSTQPSGPACSGTQYVTEYWSNQTLAGTPAVTTCENGPISHDWGAGSPSGILADHFSARWSRTATFAAGTYTVTARADDGIRLWLDGDPLIDAWHDQGPTTYTATRTISAGDHTIKVEYFEDAGGAVAQVTWSQSSGPASSPATPGGVSANPTSPTNIHVSWSDTSGETGYRITDGISAYALGQNVTAFDWAVSPGTYKCFALQSYNGSGASPWSGWACTTSPVAASPAPTVPATPSGITAVATSPSSMHVAWTDSSANESGFAISDSLTTTTLGANTTSYDWAVSPGSYKCFHVSAFNGAGSSAWTGWACATSPSAGYADVVVDDGTGGFTMAGTSSYWHGSTGGFGNHFWWTYTNTSGVDNRVSWAPSLPAAGHWEVFAFIPSVNATTTNARYGVYHQGTATVVSVNQGNFYDAWVSLGTFAFNADSSSGVFLGDETYETSTQQIAFDAIKWVWRGN
jgi:hypothetical protein